MFRLFDANNFPLNLISSILTSSLMFSIMSTMPCVMCVWVSEQWELQVKVPTNNFLLHQTCLLTFSKNLCQPNEPPIHVKRYTNHPHSDASFLLLSCRLCTHTYEPFIINDTISRILSFLLTEFWCLFRSMWDVTLEEKNTQQFIVCETWIKSFENICRMKAIKYLLIYWSVSVSCISK